MPANVTNRIAEFLRRNVGFFSTGQGSPDIGIGSDRLGVFIQAKGNGGDEVSIATAIFENAAAVGEITRAGFKTAALAALHIDRLHRLDTIADLDPVGADILDRCRTDGTRDK